MKSTSRAWWEGNLKQGNGGVGVGNDRWKATFTFGTRFGDEEGTNPEELLAAAHAGCFSMAFSNELAKAGHTPVRVDTHATVTLDMTDDGPTITHVLLRCEADVAGITTDDFQKIAEQAKNGCPVSKLFKGARIELEANLVT